MEKNKSIFRNESILYKEKTLIGRYSAFPSSILPIVFLCVLSTLTIIVFILFSNYSKRVLVKGKIIYAPSAIEITVNKSGIVTENNIKQGSKVKKGDVIASISHDIKYSGSEKDVKIIEISKMKIAQLLEMEFRIKKDYDEEEKNLYKKLTHKDKEIIAIKSAKKDEILRNVNLKERMDFYKKSQKKGITTIQESIETENNYFNSLFKINNYKISIERVFGEKLQILDGIKKMKSQKNQLLINIEHQKTNFQQQIINSTANLESIIKSPIDGIVSSLNIVNGQRIKENKIIAVIIPNNSDTLIEILTPPSTKSYLNVGQSVIMRVDSQPWQWFGKITGKIISISTTPNNLSENNVFFRVLVTPDNKSLYLPAGVPVNADILTLKRRIWEWLFIPLKFNVNHITDRD
ncbi:TPA: HlyD family efflux transporter periplasmic adaptor subunit [Providencia rettgeri]|nr:HlyD family efflux transporter periplasmic adaptor subunit [Providencia rettgeri]